MADSVRGDFRAVEQVLQRTQEALAKPSVVTGLSRVVAEAIQVNTDFYPPARQRVPKFRFATDKSRRWYWWQVRRGNMRVPYRRTGGLRKATTLKIVELNAKRFIVEVAVDRRQAPGAQYIIGPFQVPGHKDTGWPTLYSKITDQVPGITKRVATDYGRVLRGYIIGGSIR